MLSPADVLKRTGVTVEDEQKGFTGAMQYDDFNYWKQDYLPSTYQVPDK